jgi:hypothetical protein
MNTQPAARLAWQTGADGVGAPAASARRMREIHRLAMRLELRTLPAGRRLLTRLKAPARILRDALRELRRHGAMARAASRRGSTLQLMDMMRFGLADGIRPASYYRYRLFEPAEAARRRLYVQHEEVGVLLPYVFGRLPAEQLRLIHDRPPLARHRVLDDKRLFALHCRSHGLPVADSLIELARGQAEPVDPAAIPLGEDLFLKLSDEGCGLGAVLLRWVGDGAFAEPSGVRWTAADIAREMQRRAAEHGVLLQRRLVGHPAILAISGLGLSTVRLVTVRLPSGAIEPLAASLRLSVGEGSVDNFAAGGLAAAVEIRTGLIGPAIAKKDLRPIERHPDTGNPIAGTIVPFWPEAVALALRAHASFPGLPTAGWDIAILADGPILSEGNSCWCVELVQMPHRQPLGETVFPACFAAWVGMTA